MSFLCGSFFCYRCFHSGSSLNGSFLFGYLIGFFDNNCVSVIGVLCLLSFRYVVRCEYGVFGFNLSRFFCYCFFHSGLFCLRLFNLGLFTLGLGSFNRNGIVISCFSYVSLNLAGLNLSDRL